MTKEQILERLRPGTIIQVNWRPVFSTKEGPNWIEAQVFEIHASQFTAFVRVDGNPLRFSFYDDLDSTWRFIDED
jgi:hypothetical protein